MLPSAAVFLRTSVRLATSNSHSCVRARPDLIPMPQPRYLNNSCPRRRFLAQQRSAREVVARLSATLAASARQQRTSRFSRLPPSILQSSRSGGAILQEHLDEFCGAIIHPDNLQKELFTDNGAGILICLGNRIRKTSLIKELQDIKKLDATSNSSSDSHDIAAIVDQFASILTEKNFTAYYDDAMHCMAIAMPQDQGTATLTSLSITKSGWPKGTMENIFTGVKKDYPTLAWAVSERDENLTWFSEQADGSFHQNGRVLFYYGSDMHSVALSPVYKNFVSGRASLGDSNLESGGTA
ncbi:acetylglutamate kinase n-acetyl-gamma-glutamyl-phosphate reductase precursor (ARG-6) [Fusarium coicis]|nr:acetylglutamate kinase n-acetyl-gamma-glutamyl-phosphate reductase precursor (ARG-6) [Fusarium coicis]